MLWVGAALAVVAAVLLAFVPRLPPADAAHGLGLSNGGLRITSGTSRRLRVFAMTQIAASFVLMAGAGMLLKTLLALQATPTGFDMRQTLALNVPVISYGRTPDQIIAFYKEAIRRITELPGVDENIVPGPAMTVYHPFEQQQLWGGRLFVHTRADPYALASPITRIIREMSADQPIEGAATLEDIRAEALTPDRLNTLVFGGFAILALIISVVGVAGVLAFSVSARAREFAIRLALGAHPRKILSNVLIEGILIAAIGVAVGGVVGFAFARLLGGYIQDVRLPGLPPLIGSVGVILAATVIASVLPSARAARVDVMQALRSD